MANIRLVDATGTVLRLAAQHHLPPEYIEKHSALSVDASNQWLLNPGLSRSVDDLTDVNLHPALRQLIEEMGCRAAETATLKAWDGKPLGAISLLFRQPHRSSIPELQWITVYGQLAASYIEHWRSQAALRQSASHLRSALESMTDAVLIVDSEANIVDFNEAFATFHRFSGRSECATSLQQHAALLEAYYEGKLVPLDQWAVPRALRGESASDMEFTVRRTDSGETWIGSYSFAPIYGSEGFIAGAVMVTRDITRRKEAEIALRESEQRLRLALEASSAGTWTRDLRTHQVIWDPQLRQMTGSDPDGAEFPRFYMVDERDRPSIRQRVTAVLENPGDDEFDLECRTAHSGTEKRWLHIRGRAERDEAGHVVRMTGITLDITARKRAEEAFLATSQQYRDLIENSPDGIARIAPDGRYLFVNRRMAEIAGRPESDYAGKTIGSVSGNGAAPWLVRVRRIVESGKAEMTEYLYRAPLSEKDQCLQLRFVPEFDEDRHVSSVLLIVTDVTDQRRAEAAVRDRELLISALVDSASQAIFAIDTEGRIRLANQMAEHIFGYNRNELLGQNHELLIPEPFRKRHVELQAEYMRNPQTGPMATGMLEGRRKDGTLFPVEVTLSQILTQQGPLTVIMLSDITLRRSHERQLERDREELERLSRALMTAEEDTARAIARELHDDITQRLALLSIDIGKTASGLNSGARLLKKLRSHQSRATEIARAARNLAYTAHPAIVEELGLNTALEALCNDLTRAGSLAVRFQSHSVPEFLDRKVALSIYRVAQEALSNVAKHANTENCEVTLNGDGAGVQLEVVDSGKGFVPDKSRGGLGLRSMKERMQLVSGSLTIESEPGGKTRVVARAPIIP
jgi:PAS domain S-box-containing protein